MDTKTEFLQLPTQTTSLNDDDVSLSSVFLIISWTWYILAITTQLLYILLRKWMGHNDGESGTSSDLLLTACDM